MSRAVVVTPRYLTLPAVPVAAGSTAWVDGGVRDIAVIARQAGDPLPRDHCGHAAAAAAYRTTAARIGRRAGRHSTYLLSA
jgi:hypothetical protein